eukprot:TRINITY_DN57009_c0_g1_i1.p1 TRINITY_DN57009_c0_g1~~TRINITY_DN57009_c0_g1_i1.p1  ORF type:complete len:609 (-),score=61.93 TRINITY_DN57009_c0_g1_i1:236-2062(-)
MFLHELFDHRSGYRSGCLLSFFSQLELKKNYFQDSLFDDSPGEFSMPDWAGRVARFFHSLRPWRRSKRGKSQEPASSAGTCEVEGSRDSNTAVQEPVDLHSACFPQPESDDLPSAAPNPSNRSRRGRRGRSRRGHRGSSSSSQSSQGRYSNSPGSEAAERRSEHCLLRASRGHLFEHFCREAMRRHPPLFGAEGGSQASGSIAEETEVRLADYALRLRGSLPADQLMPASFEVRMSGESLEFPVLQPGVVVFEVKQNPAASADGLYQLEKRLANLREPASAAVLIVSTSIKNDASAEIEHIHETLRSAFQTSVPLLLACTQFNEAAWAQKLVARLEASDLDAGQYILNSRTASPRALRQESAPPQSHRIEFVPRARRRRQGRSREPRSRVRSRGRRRWRGTAPEAEQEQEPAQGRWQRVHSRTRPASLPAFVPGSAGNTSLTTNCVDASQLALGSAPQWMPCHLEACQYFHWPDLASGEPSRACTKRHCRRCHCGQHLWCLQDSTRGASAAEISATLRVWFLACTTSREGLCIVDSRNSGAWEAGLEVCWHVPVEAREVQLPCPRLPRVGGQKARCDLVARLDDLSFYLCRSRSQVPRKRRMPSATRG